MNNFWAFQDIPGAEIDKKLLGPLGKEPSKIIQGDALLHEELNLLMKEVTLRQKKDEVLDLPPKVRSWVPVDISGATAALNAVEAFLLWYQATDPERPNDTQFLPV